MKNQKSNSKPADSEQRSGKGLSVQRLVSCALALCEALDKAGVKLNPDETESKQYIEGWWSVENPPPGYTSETWGAVEKMISANVQAEPPTAG